MMQTSSDLKNKSIPPTMKIKGVSDFENPNFRMPGFSGHMPGFQETLCTRHSHNKLRVPEQDIEQDAFRANLGRKDPVNTFNVDGWHKSQRGPVDMDSFERAPGKFGRKTSHFIDASYVPGSRNRSAVEMGDPRYRAYRSNYRYDCDPAEAMQGSLDQANKKLTWLESDAIKQRYERAARRMSASGKQFVDKAVQEKIVEALAYESQRVPQVFKLADRNGNGVLEQSDFSEVNKLLGMDLDGDQELYLFSLIDTDFTGTIDYKELIVFLKNNFPARQMELGPVQKDQIDPKLIMKSQMVQAQVKSQSMRDHIEAKKLSIRERISPVISRLGRALSTRGHNFKEILSKFDTDGNGMISVEELSDGLYSLGVKADYSQCEDLLQYMDLTHGNSDGKTSVEEFIMAMNELFTFA